MDKKFVLYVSAVKVATGTKEELKKVLEKLFSEKMGFFIELAVSIKDDEFAAFMSEENENILSSRRIEELDDHYGLNTYDEESCWFVIKELLNIKVDVQ